MASGRSAISMVWKVSPWPPPEGFGSYGLDSGYIEGQAKREKQNSKHAQGHPLASRSLAVRSDLRARGLPVITDVVEPGPIRALAVAGARLSRPRGSGLYIGIL